MNQASLPYKTFVWILALGFSVNTSAQSIPASSQHAHHIEMLQHEIHLELARISDEMDIEYASMDDPDQQFLQDKLIALNALQYAGWDLHPVMDVFFISMAIIGYSGWKTDVQLSEAKDYVNRNKSFYDKYQRTLKSIKLLEANIADSELSTKTYREYKSYVAILDKKGIGNSGQAYAEYTKYIKLFEKNGEAGLKQALQENKSYVAEYKPAYQRYQKHLEYIVAKEESIKSNKTGMHTLFESRAQYKSFMKGVFFVFLVAEAGSIIHLLWFDDDEPTEKLENTLHLTPNSIMQATSIHELNLMFSSQDPQSIRAQKDLIEGMELLLADLQAMTF